MVVKIYFVYMFMPILIMHRLCRFVRDLGKENRLGEVNIFYRKLCLYCVQDFIFDFVKSLDFLWCKQIFTLLF